MNQVIDSCLKDLSEAEKLLAEDKTIVRAYNLDDPYKSFTRHHMNYYAVKGLQARIHLYRGNKAAALAAAMEVINNQPNNFPFVKPNEVNAAINKDYTFAQEHLFAVFVSNLKALSDQHFMGNAQGGNAIFPLTDANRGVVYEISNGGSTDLRYNNLFYAQGAAWATNKYSQLNIMHTNPETDYLRTLIPLIRVSEVFYIAAEASATPDEGVVIPEHHPDEPWPFSIANRTNGNHAPQRAQERIQERILCRRAEFLLLQKKEPGEDQYTYQYRNRVGAHQWLPVPYSRYRDRIRRLLNFKTRQDVYKKTFIIYHHTGIAAGGILLLQKK